MKRILVTGIGGFVGSHFAEHILKNTDWEIVGIDSFRNKGDSLRLRHLAKEPRLTVHTHDLQAPISDRMIEVIGSIDYVINIASDSHVDRSISDPVPFVENNVALILNVLEYCRRVKPSKLIQCSTDEVFGPALEGTAHTEWYPILPSNPYAASKAAQNAIAISYWRTYNVPLIITHCMNMIGERQDKEKFIPILGF
jgi:dTDP-glucose 4,6-dehydratase